MNIENLIVAVDFDGTCVSHEYPRIGRHIGAVRVLRRLVDEGAKLILWTMRHGDSLAAAEKWFEDNNIPLYGVQRNPTQDSWTSSPKAYAKLYIDDAALGVPLKQGLPGERPFVDWRAVEEMLWPSEPVDSGGVTLTTFAEWYEHKIGVPLAQAKHAGVYDLALLEEAFNWPVVDNSQAHGARDEK